MIKSILILTSGKKKKLTPFKLSVGNLPIDLTTASFNEVNFQSGGRGLFLASGVNLKEFNVIYFRLVGKSLETASLVANYAKKNRIKIVDRIYKKSQIFPVSQSKAQEMKALSDARISVPKTFFGNLSKIKKDAPKIFGFPFVIKSTSGKRGREVYSPRNKKELESLILNLEKEEKLGKRFFAQEFIETERRIRVMVIGGKVVGAISQLTKWKKRVPGYKPDENEKKIDKFDVDENIKKLTLSGADAVGLDIAGVDILKSNLNGKYYVIEVNAAPSWKLIKKYCKVNIEREILKFLANE